MTSFLALARTDLRLLVRSGYVWATVAVFAILLALALQVRQLDFTGFASVVTAVILLDVVVMPVLLIGLLVLLERGEGALLGLAVTPVSRWTCVAARVTTITMICAAEMILLVLLAYDGAVRPGLLASGLLGISAVASLTGYAAVARVTNLYAFIMPMMGSVLFLGLPGYAVLAGWNRGWLAWHPTAPGLTLLEGAFGDLPGRHLAVATLGLVAWLVLGGWLGVRALRDIRARAAGS